MESKKQSSFLSPQEKEKVLLCVISQKQYHRLIPMFQNGYKITPVMLETLRWCGQQKVIFSILTADFIYEGDYGFLFSFLENLAGSQEAAKLIVQQAQRTRERTQSCWLRLQGMLSAEQLEENCCWIELAKRGCWKILAEHKRFDEIIQNIGQRCSPEAASLLEKNNQIDRIIELGKFRWLTQISGGEEILLKHKQFEILYSSRKELRKWRSQTVFDKLCESSEGQEFLYHKREYKKLLNHGHFDLFQRDKKWDFLVSCNYPQAVNWQQWYLDVQKEGSRLALKHFFSMAAQGKKWPLLAAEKQHLQLLKKRQFFWWWKSLTGKCPPQLAKSANRHGGCLFFGNEEV